VASQPQRRWLHDLIERIDAVVWEADPETFQFRYVSPSAERLLGFPTEHWLRPGFWVERLHPADRDRAIEACVAAHPVRAMPVKRATATALTRRGLPFMSAPS